MNRIGDSLFCTGKNEQIVRAFVSNGVEFAVVGGLAVSWYCASRQADDMDLLVNPTGANSGKIEIALRGLRLRELRTGAFAKDGVKLQLKDEHYADILTPARDGLTFEEVISQSTSGNLFDLPVRIPSVASLIKLKEQAAASEKAQLEKHLKDIELLKEHTV